jgi:sec-independent protein translocase protein TatA
MINAFNILFFNISGGEIFIILLIVFVVFGPAKIPEIARTLGRMMNEVKKASSDISREFRKETSALEREMRQTSDSIKKEIDPLTQDPLKKELNRISEEISTEIPDVYLKPEAAEQPPVTPNAGEENSEKPIQ